MQSRLSLENLSLIFSVVGIADTYSLILDATSDTQICGPPQNTPLGIPLDCGSVLHSQYAKFLGIPLIYVGFGFYFSIFLLLYFRNSLVNKVDFLSEQKLINVIFAMSIAGILASMYFVYLQLFVLRKICQFCMLSAFTSSMIFGLLLAKFIQLAN